MEQRIVHQLNRSALATHALREMPSVLVRNTLRLNPMFKVGHVGVDVRVWGSTSSKSCLASLKQQRNPNGDWNRNTQKQQKH